ncbi:hypothetical protein ACE0DR_28930 [Azotobacter sp. CWF10]
MASTRWCWTTAGEGALRRAFEELKARLEAEGLFDRRAAVLPAHVRRAAVITSPAALPCATC